MKLIAVVLTVCIVGTFALADEQEEAPEDWKTACITETGTDLAEVDKALKGEWPDNEKLRCFTTCMMKKMGLLSEDGKLDEAMTRQMMGASLAADKVEELIAKCKDIKGADTCETGSKLRECLDQNRGPAALV